VIYVDHVVLLGESKLGDYSGLGVQRIGRREKRITVGCENFFEKRQREEAARIDCENVRWIELARYCVQ
jgi:hypothetical protein